MENQTRPLSNIAHDIKRDWKNVHYAARPYLACMLDMDSIEGQYFHDTGRSIVRYFLANAGSWRGPMAQKIKLELRGML
jgi:hypothetical protein